MSAPIRQALLGAGSNLGDRCATLRDAIARLRLHPGISALESSPVYETDPVGLLDQPAFLNLALGIETSLAPEELLTFLQELEHGAGRARAVRWGPRTLDLDLLAFENETRATARLELPHPRLLGRPFVTIPLRALLVRARFQTPGWDALRRELSLLPADSASVRLFPACSPHDT
jgi:2-amino-4-hydroxy-6-hydroxymethyldihydropteridine diphosphokinase